MAFLIKEGLKDFSISTFNPNPSRNSILPSNPVFTAFRFRLLSVILRRESWKGGSRLERCGVPPSHGFKKNGILLSTLRFSKPKKLGFEYQIVPFLLSFHPLTVGKLYLAFEDPNDPDYIGVVPYGLPPLSRDS